MALTKKQHEALAYALTRAIRSPSTGAYRRPHGELNEPGIFSRRTINSLIQRGYLQKRGIGGYITTLEGEKALDT